MKPEAEEQGQGPSPDADRACTLPAEPQASQAEPLVPSADAVQLSGLIAEPWELDDPEIIDRLRDEGMHEAVEEIEGLQERFRLAAIECQAALRAAKP